VDAARDAPPRDGPGEADAAIDASCAVWTLTVSAEADTFLNPASPDTPYGAVPIANVGTAPASGVGLFRFDVTALPAAALIQGARVDFAFAAQSSNCIANCGSCGMFDHAGTLALHFLRSDWGESHATWNQPDVGRTWGAPGASQAGVDRSSTPLATVMHQPSASERFQIDGPMLQSFGVWRQNERISFALVGSNSAVMIVATRESAAEACVPSGYQPAKMLIYYCP